MSDERKPVICPWCGGEIDPKSRWQATYKLDEDAVSCRLMCVCGACTPWGEYCNSKKEAIEAAYAAATRHA